jgi:hypothetical protein
VNALALSREAREIDASNCGQLVARAPAAEAPCQPGAFAKQANV